MSHATLSTSRWFVGSSMSSTSARWSMARASASFMRQPPDSVMTPSPSIFSVKPTPRSVFDTSSRDTPHDWMAGSANTYSRHTRWDISPWMSASTNTHLSSSASGKSSMEPLAMERSSVDLPDWLGPSRPYLVPFFRFRRVLCSRILVPYASVNTVSHTSSRSSSSSSSSSGPASSWACVQSLNERALAASSVSASSHAATSPVRYGTTTLAHAAASNTLMATSVEHSCAV
mmetsp:Transcript_17594/g.61884  ORF Transcript_17594/g.61884 Transcript_17594/m.61884 type:complete len:231 (+) Transcript_17594:1705-2397(+)